MLHRARYCHGKSSLCPPVKPNSSAVLQIAIPMSIWLTKAFAQMLGLVGHSGVTDWQDWSIAQ